VIYKLMVRMDLFQSSINEALMRLYFQTIMEIYDTGNKMNVVLDS